MSKSVNINFNYPNPENVDFSTEVQPILNTYCIACHNEETQYNNNGLILTDGFGYSSYENLMLGGNNGSPVIPFNAQKVCYIRLLITLYIQMIMEFIKCHIFLFKYLKIISMS